MPDQSYAATEHALLEEITGPLQRLAEEPLELAPADFPTAIRGYDREAVEKYVRYVERLVAELQAVRSPEAAVRRALIRTGGQISGVLRRAHETAGEITAISRSEAEDRLERARAEADELIDTAERRVRDLDADTDRIWLDRQRIMADVEDLSDQLMGLARQAGERFPDDDGETPPVDEPTPPAAPAEEGPVAWEQWADQEVPAEGRTAPVAYDRLTDTGDDAPQPQLARTGDDAPQPQLARTGDDAPQPQLTDNDETLTLSEPPQLDPAAPPEVEPRSGRLSRVRRPGDMGDMGDVGGAGDGSDAGDSGDNRDPDSAGMIRPISEAASRPRRS
jgi:cell division septum initiation protein DivIVA